MKPFSIYYPVKPKFINQKFGEVANLQYYLDNGIKFAGHNGIDFAASHGQAVYATHEGICYPEVDDRQGHGVVLRTVEPFDYNGVPTYFKTIYWHFIDNIPVTDGQHVYPGDVIGFADSTGLSTGDHLHFGLKPQLQNESNGMWYNVEPSNGYMGAVDPTPYFNGQFACDLQPSFQPCQIGDNTENVRRIQQRLIDDGYSISAGATGFYGAQTKNAVFQFQLTNNVPLNFYERFVMRGSKVGPKTITALNEAIGGVQ